MDLKALANPPAPAADPARYAMSGSAPRAAYVPADAAQAAEVVRACARDRLALVPWGGGVTLSREAAPQRYDVALDLKALNAIAHYEPDDFTVSAGAGILVADLAATLAAKGQELPLEAAEAWGATLGGVLATNTSGPRRRRFGAPRDRILGATFVTGDGVLARTGGRVVKNVAGHAVHRLLVGSRGALAVLIEASLKLPPAPPARVALVHGVSAAELADPARFAGFTRREPAVLSVLGRAIASRHPVLATDAPFTLVTAFEDDPAWVDACAGFARDALGAPKLSLRDGSAATLAQALTDAAEMPGPRLTFASAHTTPDALAVLAGRAVAERLVFHAACGRLHVWPAADEAAALAGELARAGFTLLEARGVADVAPAPAGEAVRALRGRLADALDPAGVMAFGPSWRAGR